MEKPSAANPQPLDVPPIAFWELNHVDALTAVFDASQFGADPLQLAFGDPPKDQSALNISNLSAVSASVNATTAGAPGLAGVLVNGSVSDGDQPGTDDAHDAADKGNSRGANATPKPVSGTDDGGAVDLTGSGHPGIDAGVGIVAAAGVTQVTLDNAGNDEPKIDPTAAVVTEPLQDGPDGPLADSETVPVLSPIGIFDHAPDLVEALPDIHIGNGAKGGSGAPQPDGQAAEPQDDATPLQPQAPDAGDAHPPAGYVSSGAWFSDAAIKLVGLEHHFDPAVLLH